MKIIGTVPLMPKKSAPDVVAEKLVQIPTQFGRLLYLARCVEGSRYEHYGMLLSHTAAAVHAALERAHMKEWTAWLSLTLPEQHADLVEFLKGSNRRQAVKRWSELDPWDDLVPACAKAHESRLFVTTFRDLLHSLYDLTGQRN